MVLQWCCRWSMMNAMIRTSLHNLGEWTEFALTQHASSLIGYAVRPWDDVKMNNSQRIRAKGIAKHFFFLANLWAESLDEKGGWSHSVPWYSQHQVLLSIQSVVVYSSACISALWERCCGLNLVLQESLCQWTECWPNHVEMDSLQKCWQRVYWSKGSVGCFCVGINHVICLLNYGGQQTTSTRVARLHRAVAQTLPETQCAGMRASLS